ncbi:MAG: transposase [Ardenticatenaceae bacterium]
MKRPEIEVKTCFAPLARWVLSWWPPDEKRIAIRLDATTLADRFTILAISILYRGCAIPIAWVILRGNQKGSWKPHWLALLNDLDKVIGSDWTVIALTDRGLYALWRNFAIKKLGWHPFMRINQQGTYLTFGQVRFRPLKNCVPTKGTSWVGKATCFKTNPLKCTLLACWEEGYDHPWLILTDLEPEQANVCWYGLRTWIECGFKDHKRGGWQWQNSKITDPARAERIWLAIAVATLWLVSVGGFALANMPASGSSSCLRLISPVV